MGILAGECGIGFDGANLAVQVKSGGAVVDAGTLRELQGVMANFGATRGQMVSWGEFTKTARAAARRLFFQIRFWARRWDRQGHRRVHASLTGGAGEIPRDGSRR